MKNLKKSMALLLSVIMLMSCLTVGMVASAASDGNFYYDVSNGQAAVTGLVNYDVSGEVVIPSKLGGYPVVAIGAYAFENSYNVTSFVIPDSVKTIGEDAFYGCDELRSIDLGDGVSNFPFELLNLEKLEEINIGKSVRITEDYAYYFFDFDDAYETLTKITVSEENPWLDVVDGVLYGENMTLLLYYPLSSAATTYTMPATVKNVYYPLYLAKNIQKISYNDKFSLMDYGNEIFEAINPRKVDGDTVMNVMMALEMVSLLIPVNVAEIVVDASNPYFTAVESVLYNKDKTLLIKYAPNRANKSFEIPSSVVWMAMEAFSGARNFNLTISDGFTNNLNDLIVDVNGSTNDIDVAFALKMFLSSSAAKSFSVADTNKYLKTENGVLYNKSMTDLVKYPIDSYGDYYELPATVSIDKLINQDNWETGAFASLAGAEFSVYPEYITASDLTVHVNKDTLDLVLKASDEDDAYYVIATAFLGVKEICVEEEYFSLKAYNEFIGSMVEMIEASEEMTERMETMIGIYETLYADLSSGTVDAKTALKKYAESLVGLGAVDEDELDDMLAELDSFTEEEIEEMVEEFEVMLPMMIEELKAELKGMKGDPEYITQMGLMKAMCVKASLCNGEKLYEVVWRNAPVSVKTPSTAEIKHGETLVLHAEYKDIPAGAKFVWTVTGNGVEIETSEDGSKCYVTSTGNGTATITLKVVAANGTNVKDENGADLGSSIEIKSASNIWLKIVSFFKNLFKVNRTIEQYVIKM